MFEGCIYLRWLDVIDAYQCCPYDMTVDIIYHDWQNIDLVDCTMSNYLLLVNDSLCTVFVPFQ